MSAPKWTGESWLAHEAGSVAVDIVTRTVDELGMGQPRPADFGPMVAAASVGLLWDVMSELLGEMPPHVHERVRALLESRRPK